MTASLSTLAIGTLTLSPAFDADKLEYTATTTDATNKITVTTVKADAVVEIKNGDTAVTNGGTATWIDGANIVTIKVTNGTTVRTYKVTVTKS